MKRSDLRMYGTSPFRVAVIHGGPGAPGYMAPVARELSKYFGVIEPLQTQDSLTEQIDELYEQVRSLDADPAIFLGSSWGAILALLTAARYPNIASKLVLIGSAVFDQESSHKVHEIRMQRTPIKTKERVEKIIEKLGKAPPELKNQLMGEINDLCIEGDVYAPITRDIEVIETQYEINQKVWGDFKQLRDSGTDLKSEISKIKVPVIIIHGDHDPHIIEGIHPFLKSCIPDVTLEWLKKCGHYPWIEKEAKDRFFKILVRECALQ